MKPIAGKNKIRILGGTYLAGAAAAAGAAAGAFMHSDCALERASPDNPAVCLLHMEILLSDLAGAAGFDERQLLMNC